MSSSTLNSCRAARANAGTALALLGALATTLSGCRSAPAGGPPEIRLGRDQCTECGMIINEDRCSCASRITTDKGPDVALFDDIGCLLEHERQNPDVKVLQRFVHDYTTKAWANADAATFLWADALRTPMGSGIVAFSARSAAETAAKEHPGALYEFSALTAAHTRQMQEQFGAPQEPAK